MRILFGLLCLAAMTAASPRVVARAEICRVAGSHQVEVSTKEGVTVRGRCETAPTGEVDLVKGSLKWRVPASGSLIVRVCRRRPSHLRRELREAPRRLASDEDFVSPVLLPGWVAYMSINLPVQLVVDVSDVVKGDVVYVVP